MQNYEESFGFKYHARMIHSMFGILITTDYGVYLYKYITIRGQFLKSGDDLSFYEKRKISKLKKYTVPWHLHALLWTSLAGMLALTYPIMYGIVVRSEEPFFKKRTFTYVFVYILMNASYGVLFFLIFLIFSFFGWITEESKKLYSSRKVLFLILFKLSPFIQLIVAFFGEWISIGWHPRVILCFCTVYPLFMGTIQKVTSIVDNEEDFKLDMFAEVYSLFYASLPYKLVYLGLDEMWMGFAVLFIKACFKTIIYIIVPCRKRCLAQKKKSKVGRKAKKRGTYKSVDFGGNKKKKKKDSEEFGLEGGARIKEGEEEKGETNLASFVFFGERSGDKKPEGVRRSLFSPSRQKGAKTKSKGTNDNPSLFFGEKLDKSEKNIPRSKKPENNISPLKNLFLNKKKESKDKENKEKIAQPKGLQLVKDKGVSSEKSNNEQAEEKKESKRKFLALFSNLAAPPKRSKNRKKSKAKNLGSKTKKGEGEEGEEGSQKESPLANLQKALLNFMDDQFEDRRLFTLKFLIHELSDITQDIGVFSLVYITNYILPMVRTMKFEFPATFVTQISIWTLAELIIDLFFFFFCLNLYKRFYFFGSHSIY